MRWMKIFLVLSVGLLSEDNSQFLKEIREVYSKSIYDDLRDFSFDKENITQIVQQDLERILPQYMALNNAFYDKNQGKENYGDLNKIEERYPWQYLRRFLLILASYTTYMETNKSYIILDKTFKNLSKHRKDVKILMNQFTSTSYYSAVLDKMTCNDKRTERLLKKYPPSKKDMIEIIIRDNEINVQNIEKSFIKPKEGLNKRQQRNHKRLQQESVQYFRKFVEHHNQKIRDIFQEVTPESFKTFEEYVDKQFEYEDSIYHHFLMLHSKLLIGIQNTLGIENVYFGYLPISIAGGLKAVIYPSISESWFTSEEKMHAGYDDLLKSCPN